MSNDITQEQKQNKSGGGGWRSFIFKSNSEKLRDKSSGNGKKGKGKKKHQVVAIEPEEVTLAEATSLELLRQISLEDVMLLMTPRLVLTDWLNQINQLLQQKFIVQARLHELYARRDEILQIDQLKQVKIAPAIPAPTPITVAANTPTNITDFIAANSPATNTNNAINATTGAGAADSGNDISNKAN